MPLISLLFEPSQPVAWAASAPPVSCETTSSRKGTRPVFAGEVPKSAQLHVFGAHLVAMCCEMHDVRRISNIFRVPCEWTWAGQRDISKL